MQFFGSSSMASLSLAFRLVCIICCLIAATSYNIDHRDPSIDVRNERAVTEWRFRRNRLLKYPNYFRNDAINNHWLDKEENVNNQADEIKFNEKKFIIPQLKYPQNE